MTRAYQPLAWDDSLIQRYNLSGPRYTSYPTAPQFHSDFNLRHWREAIAQGNRTLKPLSLYVHIPFCSTICYYCGCNKVVTANRQRAIPYLAALKREISLQATYVDSARKVQQLHFGGGTPTYLDDQQIADLMAHLRAEFSFDESEKSDFSLEIHPQSVTPERLAHLRALGFNRLSLGVQDFDPQVQKAVNRFNTYEEVAGLIQASRQLGFGSLNLDLIYGLPKQSCESFAQTLNAIVDLRPDRISLFNYAHMPHLFKSQKQIDARDLPEPQEKLQILHNSIERLQNAGYVYIGMDHFALPNDELAEAQRSGTLHRNFQGYTTHGDCDLFAFGASSISAIHDVYVQNHKTIEAYQNSLENNLAIHKGFHLSADDLLRRRAINQIICQFELKFAEIEKEFDISFASYFATELAALKPMQQDGLLEVDSDGIRASNIGRLLIRSICMVFDAHLQQPGADAAPRYSRII